ncbi:hypothetical protein RFI_27430 [Reticulomyxa filosa]|uniref:Uncharacterized protein n=1 Tax=Reticulomyxa filosa TaxID=46433 RepID=X6M903_RETFI|nr:hypothetical protein RFI_27430 [Reticulomyxa filosa]|eukprot:ETO09947.1 hypothetical protein RFI_27430 [Reticulomyxa filosa]
MDVVLPKLKKDKLTWQQILDHGKNFETANGLLARGKKQLEQPKRKHFSIRKISTPLTNNEYTSLTPSPPPPPLPSSSSAQAHASTIGGVGGSSTSRDSHHESSSIYDEYISFPRALTAPNAGINAGFHRKAPSTIHDFETKILPLSSHHAGNLGVVSTRSMSVSLGDAGGPFRDLLQKTLNSVSDDQWFASIANDEDLSEEEEEEEEEGDDEDNSPLTTITDEDLNEETQEPTSADTQTDREITSANNLTASNCSSSKNSPEDVFQKYNIPDNLKHLVHNLNRPGKPTMALPPRVKSLSPSEDSEWSSIACSDAEEEEEEEKKAVVQRGHNNNNNNNNNNTDNNENQDTTRGIYLFICSPLAERERGRRKIDESSDWEGSESATTANSNRNGNGNGIKQSNEVVYNALNEQDGLTPELNESEMESTDNSESPKKSGDEYKPLGATISPQDEEEEEEDDDDDDDDDDEEEGQDTVGPVPIVIPASRSCAPPVNQAIDPTESDEENSKKKKKNHYSASIDQVFIDALLRDMSLESKAARQEEALNSSLSPVSTSTTSASPVNHNYKSNNYNNENNNYMNGRSMTPTIIMKNRSIPVQSPMSKAKNGLDGVPSHVSALSLRAKRHTLTDITRARTRNQEWRLVKPETTRERSLSKIGLAQRIGAQSKQPSILPHAQRLQRLQRPQRRSMDETTHPQLTRRMQRFERLHSRTGRPKHAREKIAHFRQDESIKEESRDLFATPYSKPLSSSLDSHYQSLHKVSSSWTSISKSNHNSFWKHERDCATALPIDKTRSAQSQSPSQKAKYNDENASERITQNKSLFANDVHSKTKRNAVSPAPMATNKHNTFGQIHNIRPLSSSPLQ